MDNIEQRYQMQPVLTESQYSDVNNWNSYNEYSQDLVQTCGNAMQSYSENSENYANSAKDYIDPCQDYGRITEDYTEQTGQEYDNQGYYTSYYSDGYTQGDYSYPSYSSTKDGQYAAGWEMDPPLTKQHGETHTGNTSLDSQHLHLNCEDANTNPGSLELSSPSEQDLQFLYPEESVESPEDVMIRDKVRNNFKKFRGSPVRKIYQRQAANVRERRRMRTINEAFENLRKTVPQASDDKKTSKVDTLRLAIQYIGDLTQVLQSCGDISLPGLRAGRGNNKIIVSYSIPGKNIHILKFYCPFEN